MLADSFIEVLLDHWPSLVALGFTAYLASNYFNHGLNKYPGASLASLTDWWRFWIVYKRRPELEHIRLHALYGDVVRLGPNCLSFADPKALKTIYGLNKGFTKVSAIIFVSKNEAEYFVPSPNSTPSSNQLQEVIAYHHSSARHLNLSMRNFEEASTALSP